MESNSLKDGSKLTRFELVFLIAAATVTITLVSACSPLYPFNPWEDVNVFFVVGRGIIHGLVPYRDLFDHKGPVLHFIYAFAALISEKTFTGVWIVECIAASVFAVYSWKIAKLFTVPSKISIILSAVLPGVTYTFLMFNFGGNAEELCFPFLSIAFYTGLRSLVIRKSLPSKAEALLSGIITGILFWIKFTFTGFFLGFIICILVFAIKHKKFKDLWSLIWRFTLGFFLISLPVIAYFLASKSLGYLWESYFYNNIFLYLDSAQTEVSFDLPVIKYICIPIVCLIKASMLYPSWGVTFLLSLIAPAFADKKQRSSLYLFFSVTLIFTCAFVFTKVSVLFYYGYILSYCFALILIPLIKCINKLENACKKHSKLFQSISAVIVLAIYVLLIASSKNLYLIFKPRSFLTQCRIADTIKQTEDAKLLVYDEIDSGFFTASELLPKNRFFCYLNIGEDFTEIAEEHNRLIAEGFFDYIVTTYNCECDWDNYKLIQTETGQYNDQYGNKLTEGYKLYKKC